MTTLHPDLDSLGSALERSATADLRRRAPSRRRRAAILVVVAAALAIPTVAVGGYLLISGGQEATYLPRGHVVFADTHPTCTVVTQDVEYHCTLDHVPTGQLQDTYLATVVETVDEHNTINGGCRGLTSNGISWECYVGEKAVKEMIIGQSLLGQTQIGPGRG